MRVSDSITRSWVTTRVSTQLRPPMNTLFPKQSDGVAEPIRAWYSSRVSMCPPGVVASYISFSMTDPRGFVKGGDSAAGKPHLAGQSDVRPLFQSSTLETHSSVNVEVRCACSQRSWRHRGR